MKIKNIQINKEEEVNFFEFLRDIYSCKLLIIFVTFFGFLSSYLIITNTENSYKGLLYMSAITPIEENKYKLANALLNEMFLARDDIKKNQVSNTIYNERTKNSYQKINSAFLYAEFLQLLKDKSVLQNVIYKQLLLENNIKDKIKLNKKAWKIANEFEVIQLKPAGTRSIIQHSVNLKFITKDKYKNQKIIQDTFNEINNALRLSTISMIKNSVNILYVNSNNSYVSQISDLNHNIQFLERHLKIAQKLGIKKDQYKNEIGVIEQDGFNKLGMNLQMELNYFNKGVAVISNQIEILKNKQLMFELNNVNTTGYIEDVKQMNIKNKLEDAILNSPLSNENFSAVNYQMNSIQYTDLTKKNKFITIFTFLSFIMSILVSIFIISYKKYKLREI